MTPDPTPPTEQQQHPLPFLAPVRWYDQPEPHPNQALTVGRWGGWLVQFMPHTLYNARVVLTDEDRPETWVHGWCYQNPTTMMAALKVWDPATTGEPAGYIKRVLHEARQPGELAPSVQSPDNLLKTLAAGTAVYFGQHWDTSALTGAVRILPPVGKPCYDCQELVRRHDRGHLHPYIADVDGQYQVDLRPIHAECQLRSLRGHSVGVCACTGHDAGRDTAWKVWQIVFGPAEADADTTSDEERR